MKKLIFKCNFSASIKKMCERACILKSKNVREH
jgi:hypothetical protein